MNTIVKKAQELINQFDGKITKGTWKWEELHYGGNDVHITWPDPRYPERGSGTVASDTDRELIEKSPEMLELLKQFVEKELKDSTVQTLIDIIIYLYSCYFCYTENGHLEPEDIENFKEEVEEFSIYADREDFEPYEKTIRNLCEGKINPNQFIDKLKETK